ncbi:MAG: hypothetical protein H0W63_11440 [Gemmatimonadaceae bacterium]|nr:hypothetical protein [Gemmatimonadaceae bacterium]
MKITIIARRRSAVLALAASVAIGSGTRLAAQTGPAGPLVSSGSVPNKMFRVDSARLDRGHFYRRLAAGFATSILVHESAHFAASYAMGFHPHLGTNKGRPTVYSGINEADDKRKQFIFTAAGLTVQDILDELVLDIPHDRGGAFERGILTGGVGTTLFYITFGRNAKVSDISVMARNSNLSKSQLSLIFGSLAGIHVFRISRDKHYSRFFVQPAAGGGLKTGISISTY